MFARCGEEREFETTTVNVLQYVYKCVLTISRRVTHYDVAEYLKILTYNYVCSTEETYVQFLVENLKDMFF